MTPREEAELEAKITHEAFIKWVKVTFYWIMAMLLVLAYFNFGVDNKHMYQCRCNIQAPL